MQRGKDPCGQRWRAAAIEQDQQLVQIDAVTIICKLPRQLLVEAGRDQSAPAPFDETVAVAGCVCPCRLHRYMSVT